MSKYNNFSFMQWFYDMTTMKKMMVLLFVIVVSLISLGATGGILLTKSAKSMEGMYKDRLLPVRWLNIARANANRIRAEYLELMVTTDPDLINEMKETIDGIRSESNKLYEDYEATELLDYEVEHWKGFKKHLEEYRAIQKKLDVLIDKGKRDEAYKLYLDSENVITEFQQELTNLATFNADYAKNMYEQSKKDAGFAITLIIFTSIFSVILCGWLGYITADRIAGVLGSLGEKMSAMADGNLQIDKFGRIEKSCIGDLLLIFDRMLENLRLLVSEVGSSTEEVSAGVQQVTAAVEQTSQGANQVSQSVDQLAKGAQQISTNVTQLAAGSQEQAKQVSKSLENINFINEAVQKILDEAGKTSDLSGSTENNASEGSKLAENAIDKINQIKDVSNEISSTINHLGQLGKDIEQIVDLIKSIASQTNLLALNAAIEAARAGEHGKGFAVVAEEVKKLAGESAKATDKITGMIKEIQTKTGAAVTIMDSAIVEVDDGVKIVDNVGKALGEILKAAKDTTGNVGIITEEVQALAKNSKEVVGMMEEISSITEESTASAEDISGVTEETAASAEEVASIVEEQTASMQEVNASMQSITKITEKLQSLVSKFKL